MTDDIINNEPQGISFEIPEAYREEPCLQSIKDQDTLVKNYVEAQRRIGKSVLIPNEDTSYEARQEFLNKISGLEGVIVKPTSEEGVSEYYAKLGRPDAAENYELGISEESGFKPELVDGFRQAAYQAGLSQEQAKAVMSYYTGLESQVTEALTQKADIYQNTLKEMWGDEYNTKFENFAKVAKQYQESMPDATQDILNSPLASNPIIVDMAARLYELGQEKPLDISGTSNPVKELSEDEKNKVFTKEVLNNPEKLKAWKNVYDPDHDKVVQEINKIFGIS